MTLVQKFLRLETAGGFLLMGALLLAILAENSPLKPVYDLLLETPVELRIGRLILAKPLLLWINDALMAVFFFLVGMELKREVLTGQLSSPSKIVLPTLAAIAGIVVPALIYTGINSGDPVAMRGWAVPTATDIAFALGILALLGSRVPASLKLFLLAVAIIDDIGAIVIIAVFYSGDLSFMMFVVAGVAIVGLAILNFRGVTSATPYMLVGIILWIAVLKSGVHSTLAGIVLAMFIPLKGNKEGEQPLLVRLEHDLHATVAFIILPVFAFANAGISLSGLKITDLTSSVPLGIALGLIIGKQIGIFTTIWLAVKAGIANLPENTGWVQIYGLSALCGIGFTMSLFISSLAFEQSGGSYEMNERLGIIVGSLISAVLGYAILRIFSNPVVVSESE
ncbi:MAG: Na+/H+ antiporter NhaA [Hyphomicrobiales bacterium]|nr:Na+/H+ antiporter NhaA [Hyphomicrobiales bacterium]